MFCKCVTKMKMNKRAVIIVPGNGCTPIKECNFYGWLNNRLNDEGFEVVCNDMVNI